MCLAMIVSWAASAEAPFYRFVDHADSHTTPAQRSTYIGAISKTVLALVETLPAITKPVDERGRAVLDPTTELPPLPEGATGYRIRIQYKEPAFCSTGRKRIKYLYFTPADMAHVPWQLRPPGQPEKEIEIQVRPVFPVVQRIETDPVPIPAGARFEASIGLRQDWRPEHAARVRFALEIETDAGWERILEEVAGFPDLLEEHVWSNISVDLTRFAGGTRRFAFVTEPAPGAPEPHFADPLWGAPILYAPEGVADQPKPNLLLISLDTLRRDRIGLYGCNRPISPNLDAFAQECAIFDLAIAPSPWTTPTHASIFTGLHPTTHQAGVMSRGFALREHFLTLAEIARQNGYFTAAITEGVAVAGYHGFAQGFDSYSDGPAPDQPRCGTAETTFAEATAWIERYGRLPFMLFVHTYEVHHPYGAPEPWLSRFADPDAENLYGNFFDDAKTEAQRAQVRDLYDSSVAYADHHLGRFLDRVRALGLLENTLVVIFADHGEEFWEHGVCGHTAHVYDEVLRVPLLVRRPGSHQENRRIQNLVSTLDLFPTCLELLGLPVPNLGPAQALSLCPLLRGETGYARTEVISELSTVIKCAAWPNGMPVEFLSHSVRTPNEKYMRTNYPWIDRLHKSGESLADKAPELSEEFYDLQSDAGEQTNIFEKQSERAAPFRALLDCALRALEPDERSISGSTGIDAKNAEALRALGYL